MPGGGKNQEKEMGSETLATSTFFKDIGTNSQ